jgi:hypothetical protein
VLTRQNKVKRIRLDHLTAGLNDYVKDCAPTIRIAFQEAENNCTKAVSAVCYAALMQRVSARELDGVQREELLNDIAKVLRIPEEQVDSALKLLAVVDPLRGVLRIDGETDRVYFREPLYFVYYKQEAAASQDLLNKQALVDKFLQLVKTSTRRSYRN